MGSSPLGSCLASIRPLEFPYADASSAKLFSQESFKIPFRPWAATEEIEGQGAVFREGVAGPMRLRQKAEAGDASRARELVPERLTDRVQVEVFHHPAQQPA